MIAQRRARTETFSPHTVAVTKVVPFTDQSASRNLLDGPLVIATVKELAQIVRARGTDQFHQLKADEFAARYCVFTKDFQTNLPALLM